MTNHCINQGAKRLKCRLSQHEFDRQRKRDLLPSYINDRQASRACNLFSNSRPIRKCRIKRILMGAPYDKAGMTRGGGGGIDVMKKYKALDLFCGGGGASIGLWQAGFDVIVGIDINRNCGKRYPFRFHPRRCLLHRLTSWTSTSIWASPPCEGFSSASNASKANGKEYIDLLTPTRTMIENHPCWCIENVPNAPMRPDLVLRVPPSAWKTCNG